MSVMFLSYPSYLVSITLQSKEDYKLRKKLDIESKKCDFTNYSSSVTLLWQLISDSRYFLPNLKKGYISLPANEIYLRFFLTTKTNAGDVVSSIKLYLI